MKKLDNSIKITLIIVVGVLVLGLLLSNSLSNPQQNTVSVAGQSTIEVMPDLVAVYFSVDTKGATSKEASDKNAQISNALTDSLIALGFNMSEIQTQSYSVYPEYDYSSSSQRLIDYRATNSVKLEIPANETGKVSASVDAGINAGAGVSYISFELNSDSQNRYKAQALKAASQDATTKAQAVADGLGKRLGSLVSVSVDSYNYMPWMASASGASSADIQKAAPNIQPSSQDVTASVTAVFKIR